MTSPTTTTTQAPVYNTVEHKPTEQGRQFIVRLRQGSITGNIIANSKIITVENLPTKSELTSVFTSPEISGKISTSRKFGYYQKTVALPGQTSYSLEETCYDQREFVYIRGSTTGVVYGGAEGTPYSEDSDINTAAVHAGLVLPNQPAVVRRHLTKYYSSSDPFRTMFIGNVNLGVTTFSRKVGCGYYFDGPATVIITTTSTSTSTSTTSTSTSTTSTSTSTSTTSTTTLIPVYPGLCRTLKETIQNLVLNKAPDLGMPKLQIYNGENYTVEWNGYFIPTTTEIYTFYIENVDDGAAIWIGPSASTHLLPDAFVFADLTGDDSNSMPMTAGVRYDIYINYIQASAITSATISYSTPTIPKTSNFSGLVYHITCPMGTVSTATVTPISPTVVESGLANSMSFTINGSNIPNGTQLWWALEGIQSIDWNTAIGTYQTTSLTGFNTVSNIPAAFYEGVTNLVYLRHLGRFPENQNAVNNRVADLLSNTLSVDALDLEIYNSPEAALYRTSPGNVRIGSATYSGSPITVTGAVVPDSKFEGNETGNIVIRINSNVGPILTSAPITITDTSPSHAAIANPPPYIIDGAPQHRFSFFHLENSRFAGETITLTAAAPDPGRTSAQLGSFVITPATFTIPTNSNAFVQVSNISMPSGTTTIAQAWFKLQARVGTSLYTSTADIFVLPDAAGLMTQGILSLEPVSGPAFETEIYGGNPIQIIPEGREYRVRLLAHGGGVFPGAAYDYEITGTGLTSGDIDGEPLSGSFTLGLEAQSNYFISEWKVFTATSDGLSDNNEYITYSITSGVLQGNTNPIQVKFVDVTTSTTTSSSTTTTSTSTAPPTTTAPLTINSIASPNGVAGTVASTGGGYFEGSRRSVELTYTSNRQFTAADAAYRYVFTLRTVSGGGFPTETVSIAYGSPPFGQLFFPDTQSFGVSSKFYTYFDVADGENWTTANPKRIVFWIAADNLSQTYNVEVEMRRWLKSSESGKTTAADPTSGQAFFNSPSDYNTVVGTADDARRLDIEEFSVNNVPTLLPGAFITFLTNTSDDVYPPFAGTSYGGPRGSVNAFTEGSSIHLLYEDYDYNHATVYWEIKPKNVGESFYVIGGSTGVSSGVYTVGNVVSTADFDSFQGSFNPTLDTRDGIRRHKLSIQVLTTDGTETLEFGRVWFYSDAAKTIFVAWVDFAIAPN